MHAFRQQKNKKKTFCLRLGFFLVFPSHRSKSDLGNQKHQTGAELRPSEIRRPQTHQTWTKFQVGSR